MSLYWVEQLTGNFGNGRNLRNEWKGILDDLLVSSTDVYILDDKAAGGGDASTYSPPPQASGSFYFDERRDQEHWDGGLSGELGIGTNNSIKYRNDVMSWINSN